MLHFIGNLEHGSKKTKRHAQLLKNYCEKFGIEHEFHATKYARHVIELVSQIESDGGHEIIILGGDGMFHEALNGMKDFENTTLGLIPCGSGNDFVACGKFFKNKPVKALKNILAGNKKRIDYIQFDGGLKCLNVAGTGLDIECLIKAKAVRRLKGKPNYLVALLRVLKKFDAYRLTVTANGETNTYDSMMVGVCNGRQIGGGLKVSPKSVIDDGSLNLVIIKMVDRKRIKWILPQFITGSHINKNYCIHMLTDAVKITSDRPYKSQLDGEIYDNIDFSCHIVKKGLSVFYPN